jgi:hypothetical protein
MAFEQKIQKLYQLHKNISNTYSYKAFEVDVVNVIYNARVTNTKITSTDAEKLFGGVLRFNVKNRKS